MVEEMRKILKQWGQGLGVYFDQEDIKIYGLKENDIIDLDDMFVCKEDHNNNDKGGNGMTK